MADPAQHLILHGSITLLVGLICGWPMGRAIVRGAQASTITAWRVAHSGLALGGTLLFAVGAILPIVALAPIWATILAWAFILSAYGFVVALPYGAYIGERGLQPTSGSGSIVYWGNMVGALGSLIGAIILVFGALLALRT